MQECTGLYVPAFFIESKVIFYMDTFKLLKLKNYFFHLIVGTLMVLFGAGVLQAILLEMFGAYDAGSKAAYICGLIASLLIIAYGIYQFWQAFNYEHRILKFLEPEERKEFVLELSKAAEMLIPGQVIMTRNYLLVPVKNSGLVHVFARNRILGCFRAEAYREKGATEVQMIIYDTDFKAVPVDIRGKGSSEAAEALYEKICGDMPWVFHEDYDSFLAQIGGSGYRRKLLKQMADARMRYESGYSSDLEAEEEIRAMAQEVQERLNPDSVFKHFKLKKSK
jgi:hypothetical protein